jgi:hypothetical protein
MHRFLIILFTFIYSGNSMSQTQPFDSTVRGLYFDVDILKASVSVVDTFRNIDYLKYSDTVVQQWSLNTSIFMETKEDAWSSRHAFTFTKSPISGLIIQSGQIVVRVGETAKTKKLMGVEWQVNFDTKDDGELFYSKLKEIFSPISTQQKEEYDKHVGHIAQYSTRNELEKGIRDVSVYFGLSPRTKKYQITLSLFNEFAAK